MHIETQYFTILICMNIFILCEFHMKNLIEDNIQKRNILPRNHMFLLGLLFLWRNWMNMSTIIKETLNWGCFIVHRFSFYHHGRKQGNMQVYMVLDQLLRGLHSDLWEGRHSGTGPGLGIWKLKTHPQWHTSSNNITPTTKRHLLKVSLPMSLWSQFYLNHHTISCHIKKKIVLEYNMQNAECLLWSCRLET